MKERPLEQDGDIVEVGDGWIMFKPIDDTEIKLHVARKMKPLPPTPRLCRVTHDGETAIRVKAFYLGS